LLPTATNRATPARAAPTVSMRRSADGWVGVSDAPSMAPSKSHASSSLVYANTDRPPGTRWTGMPIPLISQRLTVRTSRPRCRAICFQEFSRGPGFPHVLYYAEVSGGVGTLYSLARTTGSPSTTVSLSPAGFPAGTQLSRVAGMDFDPGALVLYASLQGSIRGGSGKRAVATFLATVNPGTGVVTHVGLTKQGLFGLAVEPSAALPIVTTTLVRIESKRGLIRPSDFGQRSAAASLRCSPPS